MLGIAGDGEGLTTWAGGLAEKGGDGGKWRLDRIEGNTLLSMQVSVLSKNSDEGSEGTGKKFTQSMVLYSNSNNKSEMGWDIVGDDTYVLNQSLV